MKDKISFVPELRDGFPKTTAVGVEYKGIPNVII